MVLESWFCGFYTGFTTVRSPCYRVLCKLFVYLTQRQITENKYMKILLYIWQLPQHLLALVILAILHLTGKLYTTRKGATHIYIRQTLFDVSFSLGNYVFLTHDYTKTILKHELGHCLQSIILGPLYLLIAGLPSISRNIYSRICKKDEKWYYRSFPENWADKLGKVNRIIMKIL